MSTSFVYDEFIVKLLQEYPTNCVNSPYELSVEKCCLVLESSVLRGIKSDLF